MKLKCKKSYYYHSKSPTPRIKEGEYYEVLNKFTKPNGQRYWLFSIPNDNGKMGSGHFIIDDFFFTPEEERDFKINQILL